MKLKSIAVVLLFLMITNIANAFSVRYYNKDSKTYKWEVKINGNIRTIEFRSSTTGTASVSLNGDKIEIKTECGWVEVQDGDKVIIKDGCITIE
jgi:hypothetical protein